MTIPPPPPPPPWGTVASSWPAAPPPPPPPPPRRTWLIVVGIVGVTALALGLVAVVTRMLGSDGPDHPDAWDGRVIDLVDFVEAERDLDFDHPVQVDFLTDEEYSAESTTDPADSTAEDEEELERLEGQLRAVGVASGDVDLFSAFNDITDAGTLAFYDPQEQRIQVRGTEMTVGLEVTLVHELTHALQDQRFDLTRLDDEEDDVAAGAFRGLVEGDAGRVEDAYVEEALTDQERADYDAEYAAEVEASEEATSDVPPFVSASFGAPYALGEPFAQMLFNIDGNDEVDAAFDDPPFTEEHLFDPVTFREDEGAEDGLELGFEDDEELLDDGPFGTTSWYLFLAERIDPEVAFVAALGWGGDAYGVVERDGSTCVRLAFAGDTPEDEDQMRAALTDWIEVMPGGEAELDEVDGRSVLEACDPGADLDLELTGRSETALYVPSLWAYLQADASSVLEPEGARCYSRTVMDGLTYDQITDVEGTAFEGDAFQQELQAAFEACS